MDAKLTAYALNELPPDERAAFEAQMKNDPALQKQADEMKDFCKLLEQEVAQNADDALMPAQREQLVRSFQSSHVIIRPLWRRPVFLNTLGLAAAACFAVMLAVQHLKEEPLEAAHGYMTAATEASAPLNDEALKLNVPQQPEKDHSRLVQVSPDLKKSERPRQSAATVPQPAAPQMPPVDGNVLNSSLAKNMPVVPPATADKPAFTPEPKMAATDMIVAKKQSQAKDGVSPIPGNRDQSGLAAGRGGSGGWQDAERANAYSAVTTISPGKDSTFKSDVGVVNEEAGKLRLEGESSRALTETSAPPGAPASVPIGRVVDDRKRQLDGDKALARVDGTKLSSPDAAEKAGLGNDVFHSNTTTSAKPKAELAAGDTGDAGGMTKSGTGTFALRGDNTYTGGTSVNGGKLEEKNLGALGGGTSANSTQQAGGTINVAGTSQVSGSGSITPIPQATSGVRGPADVNGTPAVSGPAESSPLVARTKESSVFYGDYDEAKKLSSRQAPHPATAPVTRTDERRSGEADELTIAPRREMIGRMPDEHPVDAPRPASTATYRPIIENPFAYVAQQPLSTFSLDVDTASYANVRRLLNSGQRPPSDAVRLEELVNYFPYQYKGPAADRPIAVQVDLGEAPWQPLHRIARVAVKAREVKDERSAANFVFLLDVSGSMKPQERLPLIKQSLRLLVDQLLEDDQVAIVTYAGESGVALESTSGAKKEKINQAIEKLKAGGSTNGASGIQLAYEQAASNFSKERNNRVILCTDGDFNVGTSSVLELEKLIAEKSKSGVFLSVLGVGTDNLRDHTMQALADCGNGNYNYLDSVGEARKVLVEQMTGTLVTVAKDVKLQVEFNPAQVAAYRLIGYEKRMLAKEDFNNDKKDAGEIGAGHTVTALYEVVPASLKYPDGKPLVDDLKYAQASKSKKAEEESDEKDADTPMTGETLTVKVRYKEPDGDQSKLFEVAVTDAQKKLSENDRDFQFAVSVAGFGMLLRGSPNAGELTWENVRRLALSGKGDDEQGWRGEFIQLIEKARGLCEERR